MNILIVDDEDIAIQGILANINFADYGISCVKTANSMEQAKKIMEQNEIHIVMCDIEMPNGNGLDLIEWINEFAPATVTLILSCHTEFHFAQAAVGLSCQQYLTKPATPEVLEKAMIKAVEQVRKQDSDRKIRQLGQEYVNQMAGVRGDETDTTEQIKRYIIDHIEEELSVEQLARMFFLSQNQLTRTFKKKYDMTVIEYITDYRLRLAQEMLKSTNLTVTVVSAKVGYSNYAYFTKLFKKYSGYTPSAYRSRFHKEKALHHGKNNNGT